MPVFEIALFWAYFLIFLLAELNFAYFCSHYFFSFLSFIRSLKFSFSVLCVTYLLLFYCYLWFFTDPVLMYSVLVDCYELHCLPLGCRDGAVVRWLTSHQCGPGSIPRTGVQCGLSLLVLYSTLLYSTLYSAAWGFLRELRFPLFSKTKIWLDCVNC